MKISSLKVSNFRSLVDFEVSDFGDTTVFYGENNAGKSNILNFLHILFKKKSKYEQGQYSIQQNFYEGVIQNFANNFFNNDESKVITFEVGLSIELKELSIQDAIKKLFNKWPSTLKLIIKGSIKKDSQLTHADIITESILLETAIIYELKDDRPQYFPKLIRRDSSNITELNAAFTSLMDPINNCIYIVESGRDMHPTSFGSAGSLVDPRQFKSFLHSLYLSENKHKIFEEVNRVFTSEPFNFGRITFAQVNNELEIMIHENSIRLPIKHYGSGVLQILFIITAIVCNKNKIVCIEELEENLSPKLQSLTMLKFKQLIGQLVHQIIVSSHSSVFANPKLNNKCYLIKRDKGVTRIEEKIEKKLKAASKEHFAASSFSPKTYTDDEYEQLQKIVMPNRTF